MLGATLWASPAPGKSHTPSELHPLGGAHAHDSGVASAASPRSSASHGDEANGLPPDAPRPATGDEDFGDTPAASPYRFKVLLQNRFRHTAVEITPELQQRITPAMEALIREDARENDGLGIQRAFLRADAEVGRDFSLKLLVDFAELLQKNQKRALKQAFGEARVNHTLRVRAGLMKLPLSLYELLPIANYEFGSSSPVDSLIQDLGVGGRDIGAVIDITPFAKRRYLHAEFGGYNGDSNGAQNKAGLGLIGGRLSSHPVAHVRLGFDCMYRPRAAQDTDDNGAVYQKYSTGATCSADAEFSYRKFGVRGEVLAGKRTDSALFPDGSRHEFRAAWAIASYRIKLRNKSALTPAFRVEWLDEDRQQATGGSFLISGAVNLDFTRNVRLLLDLSRHNVQVGTKTRSTSFPLYRPNSTSGVVQLQFKL